MDFFIFWITNILSKQKVSLLRLFVGSSLLSLLYCVPLFVEEMKILYHFLGSIILLSLGILFVFRPPNLKTYFKLISLAFGSTFVVGGASMALFYIGGFSDLFGQGITYNIRRFPLKILLTSTFSFYIAIKLGQHWIEANIINQRDYCTVLMTNKENTLSLRMLIDTGNGLRDPFTDNHVIIVAFPAIQTLFMKETQLCYYQFAFDKESIFREYAIKHEKEISLRLIPFSSLGQENGLLLAFCPDEVKILWGNQSITKTNVTIGIYPHTFRGGYSGLVNPEILELCRFKEEVI